MARAKKQSDNETRMATETPAAPAKTPAAPSPANPAARRPRRHLFTWILFLAFVTVSTVAYKLHQENQSLRDPEAQARRIVAEMSELIILPEGEVPGVFPIDKSQAKEPFFKNAEDGDLLVVYRSTQQAFIYSPSRKILVNAGVLVLNPEQEEVSVNSPERKAPEAEEAEAAPAQEEI